MIIALPSHRKERLTSILQAVLHRKRVSVQDWHKLLGELRSMSFAVPGSDGCFSFLQHALKPSAKHIKSQNRCVISWQTSSGWHQAWLVDRRTSLRSSLRLLLTLAQSMRRAKVWEESGFLLESPPHSPFDLQNGPFSKIQSFGENRFPKTSFEILSPLIIPKARSTIVI